jgi:hypothetical protein
MTVVPFDFGEARAAARKASESQAATENALLEASRAKASTERAYREALAKRILSVHDEGIAWSVASDVARGDKEVARLRYERDLAVGVFGALEQACWRHAADRKDLQRLINWSEKVAPEGQYPEPARRAA